MSSWDGSARVSVVVQLQSRGNNTLPSTTSTPNSMWVSGFGLDDPLNQPLADWYGIVMGTSHEEPLMRSTPTEWDLLGTGPWDYSQNIYNYWVEGAERSKNYENMISIAPATVPLPAGEGIPLLEKVINDQRGILMDVFNVSDVTTIPQFDDKEPEASVAEVTFVGTHWRVNATGREASLSAIRDYKWITYTSFHVPSQYENILQWLHIFAATALREGDSETHACTPTTASATITARENVSYAEDDDTETVRNYRPEERLYGAEEDTSSSGMARSPLLGPDTQQGPSRQGSQHGRGVYTSYGTILNEGTSSLRASPERYRRDSWLDRVPEEVAVDGGAGLDSRGDEGDEEDDEWDLAEYGYYSEDVPAEHEHSLNPHGSYQRKVAIYGLVPLTSIIAFLFFANLIRWVWPPRFPPPPSSTLPRSFPSLLPELLLSAAFFSLTHALRGPLYTSATVLFPPIWDTLAFNLAYVLLSQSLRLAALALLRVRHEMAYPLPTWRDGAFTTAWWLALGWAVAEAATSVAQGYGQLALYRSVMVPVERVRAILEASRAGGSASTSANGSREYMPLSPRSEQVPGSGEGAAEAQQANQANGGANGTAAGNAKNGRRRREPISVEDAVRMAVDQDVEQLIHLQEREELEEVYGMPVIYIPVFVPCLQRIDSFLFSLGYTLILAWAYLRSPLSFPPEYDPPGPPGMYSSRALLVAFPLVVLVHLGLSLLHSPPVLPKIGVHTTAYVGLLVGLGGFFTGLGLWGALS
ncbi:hypothetical protein GY45DRAFT_1336201 [Cubamyces sp. BRFM 1775]|nr:hypothetical protein GY45DRAFT_1336201 [Cubamyces sp. BRFM 1775]